MSRPAFIAAILVCSIASASPRDNRPRNTAIGSLENTALCLEGATVDTFEVCFSATDPTADRTLTLPNATGTLALTANVLALAGGTMTGDITMSGTDTQLIFAVDNDAVTPSLSLEPGTGLYASADNTLAASTGGTVRLSIDSSTFNITGVTTFVHGSYQLNSTNGLFATAGSVPLWLYQAQDSIQSARVIGSADAASEVGAMLGTKYTDAASGNLADLIAVGTDIDGTPVIKYRIRREGIPQYTADARTMADTGTGSNATLTLQPNSGYVELTCQDAQGCDVTMSEAAAIGIGELVTICVVAQTAGATNFADSAGVTNIAGAFAANVDDCLTLVYGASPTWREVSRSAN